MATSDPVLIIGGGIIGPTLPSRSIPFEVYERDEQATVGGQGLTIH
jgi:hypothetical protein